MQLAPESQQPIDLILRRSRAMVKIKLMPLLCELFIVTKDSEVLRLGDIIKPAQQDFIDRCQNQLDTRGQIRACVLKARQLGLSTVIEAIIFVLAILRKNFKAKIVSHEKDSSTHILGMTRHYWDTFIFRDMYEETYAGLTHLAWTHRSDITVATAKNSNAGRSTTLQAVHASEVAFWDNASTLMLALSNAVPTFGLSAIFLESTANGVGNYFHRECNKAMRGQSEFEFFFYPWWQEPEYTAEYLPDDVRGQYTQLGELDEEEQQLVLAFKLTAGQLAWRRWHIANRCEGSVDKFHQEMPSTPHEAFISTGRNVFYLPNLLNHYRPRHGKRGRIVRVRQRYQFMDDPMGPLTIFAEPSDDKQWGVYLVGGDPTHAPGGDFACMQVINRRTLEQVAVYRRKTDPITFGKDMQMIGHYYNDAMLAPEKEGPGYATVGCIVADYYPNVYQMQRVDKMPGKPDADLFGWSTNSKTKELAVAHLVKLFGESIATMGEQVYGLILHDLTTLLELRDYVTSEKGLGYENSDGSEYDDGVMALAIAYTVHMLIPPPDAYEEVAEHLLKVKLPPAVQTGLTSGTARPIDNVPTDYAITSDADDELPEAPWEAWGRPREQEI